ncbi:MAG: DUF2167 domain-containing protein [Deltaproteobacteria bacterium]|nr:DUF2167 domain-containing protein [Deltaproteobacteria bacterium]
MTRRLGVLVALLALAATASADKAKPKAPAAKDKAPAAADKAPADTGGAPTDGSAGDGSAALPPGWTLGPKLIDLGDDDEVDLPAGLAFVDRAASKAELEKGGDTAEGVVGMIVSPDDWSIVLMYDGGGYIDDSDANDLKPDELLESYQQGNKSQNERRRSMGVPELFLDGWSEMPRYDKATHHLLWGLKGHDKDGQVVNFFTRILGRNGYLSLNLISSAENIEKAKVAAAPVITATRFKAGQSYADHKSSDKSSGMGLKALVVGGAGIAAFKLAKAGLLVKFFKPLLVLLAGIGAFFKRLFTGKKKEVQLPPDGPPNVG